jgi:YVTN family beta-propeller protein
MRVCRLGAAALLAAWVAGCGGNTTPVGVTVVPTAAAASVAFPVLRNGNQQFSAVVTPPGAATFQICLPPATAGKVPTVCSPANAPANVKGQTPLSGYGTISPNASGTSAEYFAPATIPSPDSFIIQVTSVQDPTVFGVTFVQIISGVQITIAPTSASMGTLEQLQFTPTVTGSANTAVAWTVTGGGETNIAGGDSVTGTITPSGLYTAPGTAGSFVLTATSAGDPSVSATVPVTVALAADPVLTSIDPPTAIEGSVQQDIFLSGSNVLSTSVVLAGGVPVPTTLLTSSAGVLRATLPAAQLTGNPPLVPIQIQRQNGDVSQTVNLTMVPTRPAIVASSPSSVSQTASSVSIALTGGYFSPFVQAFFNGTSLGPVILNNTRQMSVTVLPGDLKIPGLYPLVLENSQLAPPAVLNPLIPPPAGISAVNVAVESASGSIPTAPLVPNLAVGKSPSSPSRPSAVAINPATGEAIVANTGDGSVSVIDLNLATPAVIATIPVGKAPTGVAVDYLLSPPIAVVVNSGDATPDLSVINLNTNTVIGTVNLTGFVPVGSSPFSIGINSATHRAFVTNSSTNVGTVVDLVNANPGATLPCNTAPCPIAQIGGNLTLYGTGIAPQVAIDPRVNWAVVTPGGAGTISVVDLGRAPSLGDGGRAPVLVAALQLTPTVQGVSINTETHQVLFSDPASNTLFTFSLLDQTVGSVAFQVIESGFTSTGVNSLANVGIAVNENDDSASVVDIATGLPLQNVTLPAGAFPQAVAVDQGSGEAVVVNQGTNSVSIVSLGSPSLGTLRNLQIIDASPAITFTPATGPVNLTITGHGLSVAGTQVLLDGAPLPANLVNAVSDRQIVATIPAPYLASARRFIVTVQNTVAGVPNVSNATDFTVIQAVAVGNAPYGVAVDTDSDFALVTNNADNTVSVVNLLNGTVVGDPISVGTNPEGIAVVPRLGLAVVANFGSNNVSIIDETETVGPKTVTLCPTCFQPVGVAINEDTLTAAVTNSATSNPTNPTAISSLSIVDIPTASATLNPPAIDEDPIAVAIDPTLNLTATACELVPTSTTAQAGALDIGLIGGNPSTNRIFGLQIPTGVIFDPVNQVFLVANSAQNQIVIVDPVTFNATTLRAGIDPTSLDYNFQTSTLVTVNSASNSISVLDYVCPPTGVNPACGAPQVRAVLALSGSQSFSTLLQFAVAIDPKLNLAVVVDKANSRLLLIPLPH